MALAMGPRAGLMQKNYSSARCTSINAPLMRRSPLLRRHTGACVFTLSAGGVHAAQLVAADQDGMHLVRTGHTQYAFTGLQDIMCKPPVCIV